MRMANREKIGVVVTMLSEAFSRKATSAMLKAYEIALNDLTDSQLDTAGASALRSNCDFMPTPGQLRQLALCGGTTYEGRAEIAWREFDRVVAQRGGDYSVTFADGLINATVRLCGGWVQCCEKRGDDYFVWLKRQFVEQYVRLCQSGSTEEMRRGFAGRLEIANESYVPESLQDFKAYTGKQICVRTEQPIIAGPTNAPALTHRAPVVPRVEFQTIPS
jgi:hypothetical protein